MFISKLVKYKHIYLFEQVHSSNTFYLICLYEKHGYFCYSYIDSSFVKDNLKIFQFVTWLFISRTENHKIIAETQSIKMKPTSISSNLLKSVPFTYQSRAKKNINWREALRCEIINIDMDRHVLWEYWK